MKIKPSRQPPNPPKASAASESELMRKLARYTVIFEREVGEEDGQTYLGVTDEAGAIQQLRKELQEAYETCGIGQFNIVKREEVEI